jgi:hypothetical protein
MDLLVDLSKGIVKVFLKVHVDELNITKNYVNLINNTVLKDYGLLNKTINQYFIYKALIDTTKGTNDLLSYDNCLNKPPIFDYDNNVGSKQIRKKYGFVTTFILATVDRTKGSNINSFKSSTEIENNYFTINMCLPQGINYGYNSNENENGNYSHCEKDDYAKIIKYVLSIFSSINQMEVNPIPILLEENEENDWNNYVFQLIPFYIILIPFIIYIIIVLCKNCNNKIKKKNRKIIYDKLIDYKLDYDDEEKEENIEKRNIKKNSKLFELLNEFFNLNDNIKELFNFSTETTNFNNVSNLNYIGGLMGISIILTILGQIYLILYSLPMKDFGQSNFYELFNNYFIYPLFFIGLRYSPRIIFSCSGFTLSLKYLTFMEKKADNSLIKFTKFIFRQFHKYLLLLLIILFMRYSYYYLQTFFFGQRPIIELFKQNVLMVPEEPLEFFLSLFCIESFEFLKYDSIVRHCLTIFFLDGI